MTTGEFTSSKFFKYVFKDKYRFGIFSTTFNKNSPIPYYSFSNKTFTEEEVPFLELLEELITAPEFSIDSIKQGNPIFQTWNNIDKFRIQNYKEIYAGIISFANDYKKIMGNHMLDFTFDDIYCLLKHYIYNLNSSDKIVLKNLYHSFSSSGLKYMTIFDSFKIKGYIGE